MKKHEFYKKYANTPINKRFRILNFNRLGMMTLVDIYREIHDLDNAMRDKKIRRDLLLMEVEKFLK